ncbi:MAG TPA: ribonuclease D [Actinomycetota bacterium]|nr:ribonuclease D [Actinomycetota bacterium]
MSELPRVISSAAELEAAVVGARASGCVGLDTEFLRERTYRARLCLVQLATPEGIFIVDPVSGLDVAAVAELVSDPSVQVIVHAGKQDFELFFDRFGAVPANVFDIQIAAGFLGYGASLPYGRLVEAVAGRALEKGESYSDWCRRPLTEAQLRYASDDVAYLLEVAGRLESELQERHRLTWAQEEMGPLEQTSAYENDPEQAWRRVAGRGSLSPNRLGVLREVAAWRERSASRRDLPRGWVIKDPTLVEIARRAPKDLRGLEAIRGLSPKEAERSQKALLEAIAKGRSHPIEAERPAPSRVIQRRARLLSSLADAVVRARCEDAGVATELVATRSELESLLSFIVAGSLRENDYRILRGWRRELAGEAVLAVAEGRIAVRSSDLPPYIEEVELGGEGHGRGATLRE